MNISISQPLENLIKWNLIPDINAFSLPDFSKKIPDWPIEATTPFLNWVRDSFYKVSLNGYFPMTVAVIYFTSVHLLNSYIQNRQIIKFRTLNGPSVPFPSNLKRLPPVPSKLSTLPIFKLFVLLHNVFLCVYSVWTFIGMTSTIAHISYNLVPTFFTQKSSYSFPELFWQTICNSQQGSSIWPNYDEVSLRGLTFWGYLFYLSKYYEILDTVIILLKGRPSSLLQSYHHSGAILCMWAGVRYMSPPIWIFVVFNSFIHSIMYGYFTLSCLKIKVPKWFKQSLTTLQITQFVVGGSLALTHLFVDYYDVISGSYNACIATGEQAMALYINVFYLAPLTMLFGAFYIDSYRKKQASSAPGSIKKTQ